MRSYDHKRRIQPRRTRTVGFTEPNPPSAVQVGVDPARHFCPTLDKPDKGQDNHKRDF